jgi:predicted RNase H-like HicB family nuclease
MNTMRQVLIYQDEENTWVVECPSLPSCVSQGQTRGEALRNIQDATRAFVATLEEDHLPMPEEHVNAMLVAV